MARYVLLVLALCSPLIAWGFGKPVRLLAPHLNGTVCDGPVCVEDPETMAQATALYQAAVGRLSLLGIRFTDKPTFVYCSSTACYRSFGGGRERAIAYPFLGAVIAPESWQMYITQHELVHWFQFGELGAVATMRKPEWFREGMAYVYSEAPHSDIPEHYLPMLEQYQRWHADSSWADVLQRSKEL